MKLIHCADVHADSKMDTHFSKEQADKRREEIIDSFENMVHFARQNDVKAVIIAGDLFDTKDSQQKTIKKRISYIIGKNSEIDFLYLRGNHDEDIAFFNDENLSNLKKFSKTGWTKYSYENVDIYGHEFADSIPVSVYSKLNLDPARVNIVVLHGQIAEYKAKDGAPLISLPKFTNKNIDYIALGHIHDFKLKKLDNRCSWCYSGCLEGRGFDECGKKGFVLLNIEKNEVRPEFISRPKRQVRRVFVELSGYMDYNQIMDAINESIMEIPSGDIVQIELTGEISEETEIEIDSYQASLVSKFFFIRLKDKTETKIDYEKYKDDVSLKGEFIRIVKNQTDISDEEKSKIIMTGIKALAGRKNFL
ncbi:MAG: metallophosphoesterase family protein [Treponemataceae bacterium]